MSHSNQTAHQVINELPDVKPTGIYIEQDERYLPSPDDVGDYTVKLLRGTGNSITRRWGPQYSRDMSPFPWEAEEKYWNARRMERW